MTPYDKLRSIGASVETADALAPVLEGLTEEKQEAFYLWASGYGTRKVGRIMGKHNFWVCRVIRSVKKGVDI